MRFLGLSMIFIITLFSIQSFAFTIDGPKGEIVSIDKLANPHVIAVITFDGEGGSDGIFLINVGLMPLDIEFIKKSKHERKAYLDTVTRFEHLTKYAHFLNRGRRGNKLSLKS